MKYVVGVDVGATNLRVGIYTLGCELLKSTIVKTPTEGGPDRISEVIYEVSIKLFNVLGLSKGQVVGIGVGTIGPLDIKKGEVINTPNLPIRTFRLREPLMRLFDNDRVFVVNDCVAGVWGEKLFGHGLNYGNTVYLTISTGVGSGVIVDNNLLLGKDGNAHEVGHMVVRYDDSLRCSCGGVGHWEAYTSGKGIPRFVKYYVEKVGSTRGTALRELLLSNSLSPEKFFDLVRGGDGVANEICNEICKINAAGLANIINAYDPELITIGGSVALTNYELIIRPAINYLHIYTINRVPEIKPTKLGNEVVLKGAASLVIKPPKNLLEIYGIP